MNRPNIAFGTTYPGVQSTVAAAAAARRHEGERGDVEELIDRLGVGYVPPHLRPDQYSSGERETPSE